MLAYLLDGWRVLGLVLAGWFRWLLERLDDFLWAEKAERTRTSLTLHLMDNFDWADNIVIH